MTLIKREDAIEAIKKEIQGFAANYMHGEDDEEYGHDIGFVAGLYRAKTFIRALPSAEAVQGKWIMHIDDLFPCESTQECSVCHAEQLISISDDNFCPNCGADMRGGDGE